MIIIKRERERERETDKRRRRKKIKGYGKKMFEFFLLFKEITNKG